MHLIGFTIRMHHDAWSSECQSVVVHLLVAVYIIYIVSKDSH